MVNQTVALVMFFVKFHLVMLQGFCVVKTSKFGGSRITTPDINGKDAMFLQPIAGRMPNRNTISGTVAQQSGFELDKVYLVKYTEKGTDKEFGIQFNWTKIQEIVTPMDTISVADNLGEPEIINIESGEVVKDGSYKRKTTAIVGQTRQRILDGKFIPAVQTSNPIKADVEHSEGPNSASQPQLKERHVA